MTSFNGTNIGPHLTPHQNHPRVFQEQRLVYPVLSRRARGISVGVNLSPQQRCNFNCLYCQVHRQEGASPPPLRNEREFASLLEIELANTLALVTSGDLFKLASFQDTPAPLRRLNDIALSGDGEPTASPYFLNACQICTQIKAKLGLGQTKIVLITNSSMLHEPMVQKGLEILDDHQGEIWAKLDAGTEAYYRKVNQSNIPLKRILDNLLSTSRKRPIIIQTLFFRIDNQLPPTEEITAYRQQLTDLLSQGAQIKAVQLLTVARPPASARVGKLTNDELQQIAKLISQNLSVPLDLFGA